MTVTEGGYFVNPSTGEFDPEIPAIVADVANPDAPKTVFGLILAGLHARRAAGLAAFTVMSCDNVPHNGGRGATPSPVSLRRRTQARHLGPRQRRLPERHRRSDCARHRRPRARDHSGRVRHRGRLAGVLQDFVQWVVEDRFPPGGPPSRRPASSSFRRDPFEHMKIRILNGGHTIIAYPSGLIDVHFVHEGMADPLVRAFLTKVETEEILPILPPVPGTDLGEYFQLIVRRCDNPKIGDTIRRLCLDGSNRQPKFIVPSIADRLDRGLPVTGLALASALWCRYCAGRTDSGATIEPNDPNWERLTARPRPPASTRQPGSPWATSTAAPPTPPLPRLLHRLASRPLDRRYRRDPAPISRRRHVSDPPPLSLVIFDCDGVLVDSEPIALRLLLETLDEAGLPLDPEEAHARFLGRSLASTREILAQDYRIALTDDALAEMRHRLYAAFRAELRPIPGIAEALNALPAPYCVASSSQPERIELSLTVAGLWPYFRGRAFSATMVPAASLPRSLPFRGRLPWLCSRHLPGRRGQSGAA